MSSFLRRLWRGAGYVEGYGHHPGTWWLVFFMILGVAAAESWWGGVCMAVVFGPLWLVGCWERGGE